MIRLNEATLWYEVLVNPEACCMKWTSEADYIMPILTPKFLREIHGQITGDSESLGLLPTSPILNKYMYNLARSQYTQNGCKNLKVCASFNFKKSYKLDQVLLILRSP